MISSTSQYLNMLSITEIVSGTASISSVSFSSFSHCTSEIKETFHPRACVARVRIFVILYLFELFHNGGRYSLVKKVTVKGYEYQ